MGVWKAGTFVMRCRKYLIIKKIDFLAIWTGRPRRLCGALSLRQPAGSCPVSRRIAIYFVGLALEWAAAFDVLIFAPLTPKGHSSSSDLGVRNFNFCFAPVAQLDRAPGYEPGGREFESLRARQSCQSTICPKGHKALKFQPHLPALALGAPAGSLLWICASAAAHAPLRTLE
jgi:hypothetical protein